MSYRLNWSKQGDDGAAVKALPGVALDDTDEVYPFDEAEDEGPVVNVQRKKPDPVEVVVSAPTGRENPLLDLKQQAEFNLIVTESVEVTEGDSTVDVDVQITRYTRLKPYRIRRSAATGRVYLHSLTFDKPVDEKPGK